MLCYVMLWMKWDWEYVEKQLINVVYLYLLPLFTVYAINGQEQLFAGRVLIGAELTCRKSIMLRPGQTGGWL